MPPMKPSYNYRFDSIDSAVNYLMTPLPSEVVSSLTTSSMMDSTVSNNVLNSAKNHKRENNLAIITTTTDPIQINGEILPTGRVRYGPITVNPRKQPSKTLYTGRRSKYERLTGDEEEKRRVRRERNRAAATKCRTKRENVLTDLENQFDIAIRNHRHLVTTVEELEQRKQYYESLLTNHTANCPLQINQTPPSQQPSTVFINTDFLPSIIAPSISPHQLQMVQNDEEKFSHLHQPTSVLTNTVYNPNDSNNLFIPEQQQIPMTADSLERIMNSLYSPTTFADNNNNNTSSELYNSTSENMSSKIFKFG